MIHNCALCAGSLERIRKFAQREEEQIDLTRCRSCGAELLIPQPSDDWLSEEYAGYYKKRTGSVGNKRPKVQHFNSLLTNTGLNFAGKKIVEVGPGEGDCLYALSQKWPTATLFSVEANSESAVYHTELETTHFNETIETWLTSNHQVRFDYILLFDLVEHLRDPLKTLGTMIDRYLEPGGTIIATFPTVSSLSRSLLSAYWPQYKVEHLFYFSDESISIIESKLGLSRLCLAPLKKLLPVEYLMRVGSNFGPGVTRGLVAKVERFMPKCVSMRTIPIYLGETLWVASKLS